jgi:hypothetical protein
MKVVLTLPVAGTDLNWHGDAEFIFHGYGDPTEVSRSLTYGYVLNNAEPDALPVWYLNANGFAQKLNPSRPPYRKPCGCRERVLLIPNFQE